LKLWDKVSDEEKEKYQKMAHKEKLLYQLKKMEFNSHIRKSIPKALSPFNIFVSEFQGKVDTKELGKGGLFEYCYKKWNKMDESSKKKFYQKSEEEKIVVEKQKEELKARVYDIPKRAATPMNLYMKEKLISLKEKYPKKKITEIFSELAEAWKGLSDKEKKPYLKEYEKTKSNHDAMVKEFEENGFYTSGKKDVKAKTARSRSASQKSGKRAKKATAE
jgi:hypothetical protein